MSSGYFQVDFAAYSVKFLKEWVIVEGTWSYHYDQTIGASGWSHDYQV